MDNVITKQNKIANKSSKTCILLLLSLTNVIWLLLFLKWVGKKIYGLREPEHISVMSWLKLWRWEHGSWSHRSMEPANCVSKLQSINHSTLLRKRSQSVAELGSFSAARCLLDKRQQVAGSQIICIWYVGPLDRRGCSGATNPWMQQSRKKETITWASHLAH